MKQHEELYNKTHTKFKDKQKKEGLWERITASRNSSVNTVKKLFETQCTRNGRLTHTKSRQAAEKSTKNKPDCETVLAFYKVTSEGRKCLNLPC